MELGSSQPSKYRPIAPRTTSDSSVEYNSGTSKTEKATKVKRAPVACLECRKYRTKCSTHQPCLECATHNRECIYDHSADKRRREHIERREQQFQNQLDKCHLFINNLLSCIRYGNDNQVRYLVHIIRNTDNHEDIETFVRSLNVAKPEPENENIEPGDYEDENEFVNRSQDFLYD